MTILVTGAAGLIGSHLCRRLVGEGYPVVGLTHRNTNPMLENLGSKFAMARYDIRDSESILRVLLNGRIRTVFHLAAHLPHTANPDFVKVNSSGTTTLLAACHAAGVVNFVYASSMSVYSSPPKYLPVDEVHPWNPTDLYGQSKLLGEQSCTLFAGYLRTTILRYSSVFGKGDSARVVFNFATAARKGQPIYVDGDGSQSSDFTFVEDAVDGTIQAWRYSQNSGEVYNIGSGQEVTVLEMAHYVSDLLNSTEILMSGKPATRPFRFVADITKAKKELGYSPRPLSEGLRAYWESLND